MNTLNELLIHPVFQRLGWTLVHSLWQGAAVALLAAIAMAMLCRRAPAARYVVGCAALLLILVSLVATFFALPGPLAQHTVSMPTFPAPAQSGSMVTLGTPFPRVIPATPTPALAQRLQPLLPFCSVLWIIGITILSIRHVGGWMRVQQLRRHATPLSGEPWEPLLRRVCEHLGLKRVVRIAESALVQVPSVAGYFKPVILLPICAMSGLSSQQLEGLIAHELAHVRRHDYVVNLVQIVIETLLFYHPAAWWISRRIRQERENCCDDLAASVCANRIAYVQALAAMEELRMVPGELVLAARGGTLLPRVRRLLGVQSPGQRSWSLTAAIIVVVVALVPLFVAQRSAKAEKAAPAASSPATARSQPYSDTTAFPINPNERATLETKLGELNFEAVALGDVIDFLRDITNVNIVVDWKALESVGIDKNAPVTLRARNVSFKKALQLVLDALSDGNNTQFGFTADDNVIRVGLAKLTFVARPMPRPAAISPEKVAEIRQKLLAEELENDLKELSRQKSMLEQLQAKFGPNQAQVIEARGNVDRLTKRVAELTGPIGSSDPFATVDLQMKQLLEQKLPEVNFAEVALSDVFDFLRDVTSANIFVNWRALEAAGTDKNAPVTLRLKNVAFGKVLDLLLDSVGGPNTKLAYTADQGVISISVAGGQVAGAREWLKQAQSKLLTMPLDDPDRVMLELELKLARDSLAAGVTPDQKTIATAAQSMLKQARSLARRQTVSPATVPSSAASYRAVRIVVGPATMTLDGDETTWEKAKETLAKLPDRGELVLEVAVASDQMTLAQHDEAVSKGMLLANELKFKYLSDVGVHSLGSKAGEALKPASTRPATQKTSAIKNGPVRGNAPLAKHAPGVDDIGEYYVFGDIARNGVYSKTARSITLKQALIAAGLDDKGKYVRLIRREEGKPEFAYDVAVAQVMSDPNADRKLANDDEIIVSASPFPEPDPNQQEVVNQPKELTIGQYYVGGHVKRTGVYSTTGRHLTVRHALIAAGGADEDGKFVSVTHKGDRRPAVVTSVKDVFTPSSTHNPYLQPDDTVMVLKDAPAPAP